MLQEHKSTMGAPTASYVLLDVVSTRVTHAHLCFHRELDVSLTHALMRCCVTTVQVVPLLGGLVALAMFISPMNAVRALRSWSAP